MKNHGLILTPPEPDHWELGSGLASARFGGDDINDKGDWTPWKMADEHQKRFGFETMNCTNYAAIKAWLMLARFQGFPVMRDASERYTGVHTGTTIFGNNPHHVAEVIRRDCGLVPEAVMPWHDDIDTLDEYYDRRQAMSLLPLGRELLEEYELGHEWVFPPGSTLTPKQKRERLQAALRRGTVTVSVLAWRKDGRLYTKPKGARDNHLVTALRFEGSSLVIHDQYSPFEKKLTKDYDFNAAKLYFLKRRERTAPRTWWTVIAESFSRLISKL